MQRFGWMKRLMTNQGMPFRSRLSQAFSKIHIEHRMKTSCNQQADGLAEWANKTVMIMVHQHIGAIGTTKGLTRFVSMTYSGEEFIPASTEGSAEHSIIRSTVSGVSKSALLRTSPLTNATPAFLSLGRLSSEPRRLRLSSAVIATAG